MNKLDRVESYKLFRTNEIRENGSYTDINSLVNQSVVDYEAGYTQAVTDQSDTLTQYKNELDTLITHVLEHLEYNSNDENSKQTIVRLCNVIKKQLLNNE